MIFTGRAQATLIVSCVSLASLIIVGAAIVFFPQRTPILADYLPAEDVILYAHNITTASRMQLERVYPDIGMVSIEEGPVDAALIMTNSGPTWIVNSPDVEAANISAYQTSTGVMLSTWPQFRALEDSALPGGGWLIVRGDKTSNNEHIFDPFTSPTTPWLVQTASGGILRLSFIADNQIFSALSHTSEYIDTPDNVTALRADNLITFGSNVLSLLSTEHRDGLASILQASIESTLPADISLVYDILPLMQSNAVVKLAHSGGLLLRGVASATDVERVLGLLQESFDKSSFSTDVQRQTYDEDSFSMDFVTVQDAQTNTEEMRMNGWLVKELIGPESALFTARQGGQFIIATNKALFNTELVPTDQRTPTTNALPLAALHNIDHEIPLLFAPTFVRSIAPHSVSLERFGPVFTLTFTQ